MVIAKLPILLGCRVDVGILSHPLQHAWIVIRVVSSNAILQLASHSELISKWLSGSETGPRVSFQLSANATVDRHTLGHGVAYYLC